MAITLRNTKGSALTHTELDGNFTDLNTRITTLEGASDSDSQTLILVGTDLTISGGNTVDLSSISGDADTNTYVASGALSVDSNTMTLTMNDASTVDIDVTALNTSESDTLSDVTTRGATSSDNIDMAGYNLVNVSVVSAPDSNELALRGGDGVGEQSGENIALQGGNAAGTGNHNGGSVHIEGGNFTGTGIPGSVYINYARGATFIGNPNADTVINSNLTFFTNNQLAFEGATDDSFETVLTVADPTADRTITFPDASGTVALTSDIISEADTLATVTTRGATSSASIDMNGNNVTGVSELQSAVDSDLYIKALDASGSSVDGGSIIMNAGTPGSGGAGGYIYVGPLANTTSIEIGGGPGYSGGRPTNFYGNVDFANGTTVDFTGATVTGLPSSSYGDSDVATYLNGNLDTAIVPDTNSAYDLGTAEKKFRDLYLSSATIYMGTNTITGTNDTLTWNGTGGISTGALKLNRVYEEFNNLAGATGVVDHDCATGHIFNHGLMSANFTANFINIDNTSFQATTVTLVLTQGVTAYIPNAVQINGASQTINWAAGIVPTGNSGGIDVVEFSILSFGSDSYTVLGQLAGFAPNV